MDLIKAFIAFIIFCAISVINLSTLVTEAKVRVRKLYIYIYITHMEHTVLIPLCTSVWHSRYVGEVQGG